MAFPKASSSGLDAMTCCATWALGVAAAADGDEEEEEGWEEEDDETTAR